MSPAGATIVLFRSVRKNLNRPALRRFAQRLGAEAAGGREFCCLIAGDAELARLNRQFRGNDYATDVLSFPSGDQAGSLGDIAISVDRAAEQAREHGHSLEEEISILMLHGLLHLLGMDHERDRGDMARAERRWRKDLALPSGLIERVRA